MSEWISVEDRLPEDNEDVLTTQFNYLDESKGRYFIVGYRKGEHWYDAAKNDDDWNDEMFMPSHWMPLPEPPNP